MVEQKDKPKEKTEDERAWDKLNNAVYQECEDIG
jgi:deoxyhypusine synthase